MTFSAKAVITLWTEQKLNTAEIAKQLRCPEYFVANTIYAWRQERRERAANLRRAG